MYAEADGNFKPPAHAERRTLKVREGPGDHQRILRLGESHDERPGSLRSQRAHPFTNKTDAPHHEVHTHEL